MLKTNKSIKLTELITLLQYSIGMVIESHSLWKKKCVGDLLKKGDSDKS